MPNENFEQKIPEMNPAAEGGESRPGFSGQEEKQKLEELKEKIKENWFFERLSVLKIEPQETRKEDMEKLKSINEKIEQIDSPWVVRVMDEIKRKGGEKYLLEHFGPEDVETLNKMSQKRGYDLSKEGIVSHQAKELASALMQDKKWQETLGARAKERIRAAGEELGAERETEAPEEKLSLEMKEARAAEEKREKTHEEIGRHLVEHPLEALGIFKSGVGLKLEKVSRDFATFWEKTGARALKNLSWIGEKAVGYPAGELNRIVWTVGEFFEARPGIKRLDNILKINAHLERLRKGELTAEQAGQLEKLQELHVHAVKGQWQEVEAFNRWHERKKNTLEALRTFSKARKKLSGWMEKKEAESKEKKEQTAERKAKEIAEKF